MKLRYPSARWTRVVADVKVLAPAVLPSLPEGAGTVAVTKHLCGGATDSSLTMLTKAPLRGRLAGVVLVPCCHQKAKFSEYVYVGPCPHDRLHHPAATT